MAQKLKPSFDGFVCFMPFCLGGEVPVYALCGALFCSIRTLYKTDMTEIMMKNLKRFIALGLALALSVLVLSSCSDEKSDIVASYDGDKFIYEDDADFSDFYNLNRYFYAYELSDDESYSSTYRYNTILSDAVRETVTVRVLEDEMARRGYTVDMEKVYEEAANDQAAFQGYYSGGFEQFCSDWGVSENVFVLYNKYEALRNLQKQFIKVSVSDEEAQKYYKNNPEKYFKIPHYDVQTLFLQVLDPSNEKMMNEAYNDALIYIQMLNSGRTWENVKATAFYKYNAERGMTFTEHLSCLNHISMKYFLNIVDFETQIQIIKDKFYEEHQMTFEKMFPGGFETYVKDNKLAVGTKEYNKALEIYMNYASELYNTEFYHAITAYWQEGKTYSKPIYHAAYNSYVVLTFSRIEEEDITITFEEAKESIVEILEQQKKESGVDDYISQIMDELKVQIQYK
jgi:hypothetical protein